MERQKILGFQKERMDLNEAYHQKLAENERKEEERTAKKRDKRNRKKGRKDGPRRKVITSHY